MDREAIEKVVREWFAKLADDDAAFTWPKEADQTAYPAFLVEAKTKEGDDYKAGAIPVRVKTGDVTEAMVKNLHDAVVNDPTLGGRAKQVTFERPTAGDEAGTLVVIPL